MRQVTLVQVEASGIQEYLFGSNNLRQNIGASELVARATTEQVVKALDKTIGAGRHNVRWEAERVQYDLSRSLADTNAPAEVIYAGGGNALLLFEGDYAAAKPFVTALTTWLLHNAEGLGLVIYHQQLDWDNDSLTRCHQALRKEIGWRKAGRHQSTPMLGLGVTATCAFTGLPAVGREDLGTALISRSVEHKLAMTRGKRSESPAERRLGRVFPQGYDETHEVVRDFGYFGARGESSYIAVVHTDGNRMGRRFQAIAETYPMPKDNSAYIVQLRALSEAVINTAEVALRNTIERLLLSKRTVEEEERWGEKVPVIRSKEGRIQVPFRPLVFGGDDTTFVCEGRFGLDLAMHYLGELAREPLPGPKKGVPGEPLYGRAGVAIVKSHYPFSRAYDVAEALGASAKAALQKTRENFGPDNGILLDWHVSTSGALLGLKEIRRREYTADSGASLLMRPVWKEAPDWRSWQTFRSVTESFQKEEQWPRNKVKALRDALRQGPEAVEAFRSNFRSGLLPKVSNLGEAVQRSGWNGSETPYFDPIEMSDFFLSLGPMGGSNGNQ